MDLNVSGTRAMPPLLDLKQLAVGAQIYAPLLVADVDHRSYGPHDCTVLTFANATGRLMSAPFWSPDRARVAHIARGDVVRVAGEVGAFRDRKQLRVTALEPVPRDTVDWTLLLPSVADIQRYWTALDAWRTRLRSPRLRHTLGLLFDDAGFRQQFERAPASVAGHHARLGGLLQHTWEVAAIGRSIATASGADTDLVLAGALLHDIGKVEAYRWDGGFETTDHGALLGHVTLGALMFDRCIAQIVPPPCTDRERAILLHLILSHHGRPEFGAATRPMTLEAEILHHADDASAKTDSMGDALADPDNFGGATDVSLRGIWQLDRRRVWQGQSDWGR